MSDRRIRVGNGMFTVVYHEACSFSVVVNDVPGMARGDASMNAKLMSKAIESLIAELDAARLVIDSARLAVAMQTEGLSPTATLRSSLDKYERLVGDYEPPSSFVLEQP